MTCPSYSVNRPVSHGFGATLRTWAVGAVWVVILGLCLEPQIFTTEGRLAVRLSGRERRRLWRAVRKWRRSQCEHEFPTALDHNEGRGDRRGIEEKLLLMGGIEPNPGPGVEPLGQIEKLTHETS